MMIETTELSGVYKISVPTPFPVGAVNCYVIEGEPLTLIDVGPKTEEAVVTLRNRLDLLGFDFSDIEQILITHGHIDHAGLTASILENSGAAKPVIRIHSRDAERILDNDGYINRRMKAYLDIVKSSGVPNEFYSYYNHERLVRYFSPLGASVKSVTNISHGDTIETGIGFLEVHHTPGHSMGSVCYLHHESNTMFSGDTLLKDISSNPSLSFDENELSLSFYLRSLESLQPWDHYTVLPGHRHSIDKASQRIEELQRDYHQKRDVVLGLIDTSPHTVYQVSRMLFGEYPVESMVLALAETRDYIRILEKDRTDIIINEVNGVYTVSRTYV
ncbi:MAG: MBL fold metallo-hydrolase [Candidatus Lokiarchaeota archaeon]|nr:MBL fold metallo-hydrolase [Candidatus Lokiarchaeota archaeon]